MSAEVVEVVSNIMDTEANGFIDTIDNNLRNKEEVLVEVLEMPLNGIGADIEDLKDTAGDNLINMEEMPSITKAGIINGVKTPIIPNVEEVTVFNDVKTVFSGHRSLVANYESDSSSGTDGTSDSEPDSTNESSGSSNCTEDENVDIVDKIIKPVEEITITVSKDEAQVMGTIKFIVEDQVIVQPLLELAALDLATILFLDEGARPLGKIEDVIGPITEPIYCVNFSSAKDIESKQIKAGMTVYYAPKTDHTAYVPLPTLMKQKGSDASWEHNEEVPDEFKDFSDDDEETRLNQTRNGGNASQPTENKTQRRNQRNWFERRGRGGNNRGNFQRNMPSRPPPNMYHQQMQLSSPLFPPANYNMPPGYYYQRPPPPPPPPFHNHSFPPHPHPDFSSPPPPPMPYHFPPHNR